MKAKEKVRGERQSAGIEHELIRTLHLINKRLKNPH